MLFALRTKSALTFLGGADSKIQVGSDSLFYVLSIYKFVTTNTFNCHNTLEEITLKTSELQQRAVEGSFTNNVTQSFGYFCPSPILSPTA